MKNIKYPKAITLKVTEDIFNQYKQGKLTADDLRKMIDQSLGVKRCPYCGKIKDKKV